MKKIESQWLRDLFKATLIKLVNTWILIFDPLSLYVATSPTVHIFP